MDDAAVVNFLHELGQLRRVPRTGWWRAGVDAPESVAEHALRAAQIGFMLATAEGHDHPRHVAAMLVFHEMGEARIGDLDRTAKAYLDKDAAEVAAVEDQVRPLGALGSEVRALWDEYGDGATEGAVLARDAESLEMALTAREYADAGHGAALDWIDSAASRLSTPTAKRWLEAIRSGRSTDWWRSEPSAEL